MKFRIKIVLCVLARKLVSLFGHPMQISTQVQLVATVLVTTCKSIWPGSNTHCCKG